MKTKIQITITGRQGSGKSRFAREVLEPALRASGLPFEIVDGDGAFDVPRGTRRRGVVGPKVCVKITNEEG